jgi:hypothetical protein
MSGAYALSQGKDDSARAAGDARRNISAAALSGNPEVALGDWAGRTNNAVTVTLRAQAPLTLSGMFVRSRPTLVAEATAAVMTAGEHCMVALEKNEADAIKIGGNALLRLGCGIASNSRHASAIRIFGSAQVEADPLSAVGGIVAGTNNLIGNTTRHPYATEQPNPLSHLTTPPSGTAKTYDKNKAVLERGTYADLEIKADHTMESGVYVIDGGTLRVNGNNSLRGDGVVIVLKNGAKIDINGGSVVDLKAPTTAQTGINGIPANMAGVLIYEDAATSTGGNSRINGNATLRLGGAVYLPKQEIDISGNASPSTQCLLLVARRIEVSGNPIIPNSCPPGADIPFDNAARMVRLVD